MSKTTSKPPVQAEAEGDDTVTVEYAGKAYTLPASLDDAPLEVTEAIDDQKITHALRALLGDEQWQRFKATQPKNRDANGLFEAYAKAIGLESVGE